MDCVENCGYNNLSLSRIVARVFSLKSTLLNMLVYIVCKDLVYQIWQIGKTECFASISWEGLTCEIPAKTNCHHMSWLFAFQSCAKHMLHFVGRLLAIYPRKLLCSSLCLESSHSLSHTTLTKKSHIKYRYIRLNKITIKFGTE